MNARIAAAVLVIGLALGVAAITAPELAVAGAAGLLFLVIAARSFPLGVCLFVLLTFFDRSTALQSGGLTVVKAAGAALALLWLYEVGSKRRAPSLFRTLPRFSLVVLFLVAWTLASALWAPDSRLALTGGAGGAFRLLQGITLFVIVFTAFTERRHLWWLIRAFVGGAAFAAIIGLVGVYGQNSSVNDARLSGGFDDPNELAAVLVPALVFCGFAFEAARGRAARWIYAGLALPLMYALAQTDSQAGLVALGLALVLSMVFSGPARAHAILAVSAFLVVAGAYYTFVTEPVAIQTIASSDNVGNRESLWTVGAHVFRDHPFVGVGAGNFVVVEPAYAVKDINLPRADLIVRPELVHNSYLQVLVELGAVGLLAFLAIIGGSLLLAARGAWTFAAAGDTELELLSRAVCIGTIAMLAAYFFATNQYEKQLWLLLAVGPATFALADRLYGEPARAVAARPRRPAALRPAAPSAGV
jgi:O-antigen ligase